MEVEDGWYTRARAVQNLDDLNDLMKELMEYHHDYDTIVHACVAAAIGATWCMDKSPRGGITCFQGEFIGMHYLTRWLSIEGPWKRVMFEKMLFPQYEDSFRKKISRSTFDWLKEQAKKKLDEAGSVSKRMSQHWASIVAGTPPFGYVVEDD